MSTYMKQLIEETKPQCTVCHGPLEVMADPGFDEYDYVCKNPDCPGKETND